MKLLVSMLAALTLHAAANSDFDAANRAYDEGKFKEAAARYETLVEAGQWSANLFYNLGNTEVRLGEPGRAMLNYERALALAPGHADARANRDFLRKQSTAKTPERTWRDIMLGVLSFDGWLIVATAGGWIAALAALWPFATRRRAGAGSWLLGLLGLFAVGIGGAGVWHARRELDAAIVIVPQVEARLAPADRSGLADVLPAGSRVRWIVESSGWIECELPSGGIGWVPAGSVQRVRIERS
jgi:tetratricopeptide (TPR) repeat protein